MYDIVILMCGLAGLIMIVGSILLLYTGVIKLSSGATEGTLDVDLLKQVKLRSTNPAIAMFAIGLILLIAPALIAKPEATEINIVGRLNTSDPSLISGVTLQLYTPYKPLVPSHTGEVADRFIYTAKPQSFRVHVTPVGYQALPGEVPLIETRDGWTFEFNLGDPVARVMPTASDRQIEDADADLPPPELQSW